MKHKVRDILKFKMADFVEAKFKYLATFEEFEWRLYLTVQHPIHKNLVWVFFSNAILENAGEGDDNPCRNVAINTFVMGVSIRVTQDNVATTFGMPNKGLSDKHSSYPSTMLIHKDMLQTSHCMKGFYTYLYHISFDL